MIYYVHLHITIPLHTCVFLLQELLRVVLGYTVCSTEDDSAFLQTLLKPLVLTLLTRCADAQR